MKKTLFALAAMALALVSCKKDGGDDTVIPLEANLTFAKASVELVYGEPATIAATVETAATVEQVILTGVKAQDAATYVAVGEAQTAQLENLELAAEFYADTKEMTAIEVKLVAGKQEKAFYLPATVTGELKGTVWTNDAVTFKAAPIVATYENDKESYPVEGTGAGCDLPSFFSMRGVEVNGEGKHVLSLTEARGIDGLDVSMSWVNVIQNTSNLAYIGGQRGLAFVRCNSLGAGTVGRQCDLYEVDGHKINIETNTDNSFGLSAIRGSWAGDRYNEEEYKFVDKLFLDIQSATTNLEKIKAFHQLSQIQQVLDNATLGVEENPTNLSNKNMYRRYVEAGQTSTKAMTEEFRAGDYFIIRTTVGTAEAPQYLYGIIQVLQLPDDSFTFTLPSEKVEGKMCMDQELTKQLFEQPAYFAIQTQCVR